MTRIQNTISKNAHLVWAFLLLAALFTSIAFMDGNNAIGKWAVFAIIAIHILFSSGVAIDKYRNIFAVFSILFLYSIFVSLFKARSALIALQMFSVFYLFCTLYDIKHKEFQSIVLGTNGTDARRSKFINWINYVVIAAALVQALMLCSSYIQSPVRATGLFLDYSHASFFIVLCFGIIYPSLRSNALTALLTTVLFLGVFTTFSRTSNFLIFIFLSLMFIAEYRQGNLKRFWIVVASISAALLCVYLYPLMINTQVVDRGGLQHLAHMNSRVYYWQFAVDAIKLNPIWGYGPGNYEFLGVKDQRPYELITFAHNDYLQVWVALGVFWLLGFVSALAVLILKYFPTYIFKITTFNLQQYCSWVLLACGTLYMLINFIVFAMPFQILFAIILVYLVSNEQI